MYLIVLHLKGILYHHSFYKSLFIISYMNVRILTNAFMVYNSGLVGHVVRTRAYNHFTLNNPLTDNC